MCQLRKVQRVLEAWYRGSGSRAPWRRLAAAGAWLGPSGRWGAATNETGAFETEIWAFFNVKQSENASNDVASAIEFQ